MRFKHRGTTYGVTFHRRMRFAFESWRGMWGTSFSILDLGPMSFWRDSLPAQTVGERGVW